MVQNQVLSEHVVEVHGQTHPASRYGLNHAWDGAEGERMEGGVVGEGFLETRNNGTVSGRNQLPLQGGASEKEDSGSGGKERDAVSGMGETALSAFGDGEASELSRHPLSEDGSHSQV